MNRETEISPENNINGPLQLQERLKNLNDALQDLDVQRDRTIDTLKRRLENERKQKGKPSIVRSSTSNAEISKLEGEIEGLKEKLDQSQRENQQIRLKLEGIEKKIREYQNKTESIKEAKKTLEDYQKLQQTCELHNTEIEDLQIKKTELEKVEQELINKL